VTIFFNYSIDCELPPDGTFGGPATWGAAEASARGFIEVMDERGLRPGATLFVYPDVAMRQRALFREMADAGIETALHLHGMRYSRMRRPAWLGSLSYEEQVEVYRMAKADVEDVTGKPCRGYRACYASANHFTFPALEEAGFVWASTSAAGNYRPEIEERWAGGWRFPYHPSRKNKLVPGDLRIYEIPIQRSVYTHFGGDRNRFLDARAETPPELAGPNGEAFRLIVEENLEEMERCDQPVRVIIGASHNTNPYADRSSHQHRNLVWFCRHARECIEAAGHEFVPASYLAVKEEGERVEAF